jgi:hypothetical protein
MDGLSAFGFFSVTAMLLFCLSASAYGFVQGAWPFGSVEAIWAGVAVQRWRGTP